MCVTGNPGITDFYTEFGAELHKTTNLPVCVVGHSGHEETPKAGKQKDKDSLETQINHKFDLINKINPRCDLHLVGHSIGAWILLEMLHQDEDLVKRAKSVHLLFPTIQKMAISRNGKFLNNILRRVHVIAILIFALLHMLPKGVKEYLISTYLSLKSLPQHYVGRISKYLNPRVLENVLQLAYDEMDRVVELNTSALERVKHKTNVVYAEHDGWAPAHYMDDLKPYQPQLTMKQVPYDHSFVLRSSEPVAELVADYIKTVKKLE